MLYVSALLTVVVERQKICCRLSKIENEPAEKSSESGPGTFWTSEQVFGN
jgi:hypothetical protein